MRRFGTFLVVSAVALVVVACVPKFPNGSTASAPVVDGLPVLSWSKAIIDGEGDTESIAGYRIEIDGTLATTIAAPATFCTLLNLTSSTSHAIKITAVSAKGAGSQGLPSNGVLTASITPPSYYGNGGAPTCVTGNDADGDGLTDEVETGTGAYVSATSTGSSPKKVDTDLDGLSDREEVLGTAGGLDLPSFGVSPTRKDLLFEYDWFDDSLECGAHSHRPTAAVITRLTDAFAAAPVANPDGSTGVRVVVDAGQGGVLTGGNVIPDADGVLSSGVNSAEYLALKGANFAANREGSFHYVLAPHKYNTNSTSSGQAEINGDDLIVSLYCFESTVNTSNTIMHEVGHNLGLRHGGQGDSPNYKPNYNSVMNYRYQFPGIDTTCDAVGDGVLSYSTGTRVAIDENAINEANGVCGSPADLNSSGGIDAAPYALDLTQDFVRTVLVDWNDWSAMNLAAIDDGDGASPNGEPDSPEVITEQPVPTN